MISSHDMALAQLPRIKLDVIVGCEGWVAYSLNTPIKGNPYHRRAPEWRDWHKGWLAAYESEDSLCGS